MERTGKVEVAIRPENIHMSKTEGDIRGTIETMYYLGDVNDCRVRVGDAVVRVIAEGYSYREFSLGDEVLLTVREFIVFDDDGSLEEKLKIKT